MADCFESNMSRKEVLALYRRLLQTSKTWLAYSGLEIDTKAEQEYIRSETVRLFRKNKDVGFSSFTIQVAHLFCASQLYAINHRH